MTLLLTLLRKHIAFSVCLALTLTVAGARANENRTLALAETGAYDDISQLVVRKQERRLYLMSNDQIIRSYRISLGQTPEGHKLYEGDSRTPEGSYTIDYRNPHSDFHKSIRISYPSPRDRELATSWGLRPGGNIMIHGLPNDVDDMAFAYRGIDWTDGCIAVTNEEMDEIWRLVEVGTPIRILP
jgi:murein L,D-transpeptidase YafK